jgi:xanthine dehydrogenase molybdopterin-binding subunit B
LPAPRTVCAGARCGGQVTYLEGQVRWRCRGKTALPAQLDPASGEVQLLVAHALALHAHHVAGVPAHGRRVRWQGIAGTLFACVAAILARQTGHASRCADRDDDMMMTGKRHGHTSTKSDSTPLAALTGSNCHSHRGAGFPPPVRPGQRSGDVPLRQRVFPGERRDHIVPLQDEHGSETAFRGFGGRKACSIEYIVEEPQFLTRIRSTCAA